MDLEVAVNVFDVSGHGVFRDVHAGGDALAVHAVEEQIYYHTLLREKPGSAHAAILWPAGHVQPGDFAEDDVGDPRFAGSEGSRFVAAVNDDGADRIGIEGECIHDQRPDIGFTENLQGIGEEAGAVIRIDLLAANGGEATAFRVGCEERSSGIRDLGILQHPEIFHESILGKPFMVGAATGVGAAGAQVIAEDPDPGVRFNEFTQLPHQEVLLLRVFPVDGSRLPHKTPHGTDIIFGYFRCILGHADPG